MKIIKRGTNPLLRIHEATCTNCETVLEFTEAEARKTYDQREGNFLSIECPVCYRTITKDISSPITR